MAARTMSVADPITTHTTATVDIDPSLQERVLG
jgi:hypothetical protein